MCLPDPPFIHSFLSKRVKGGRGQGSSRPDFNGERGGRGEEMR
jgi:hypothetical protein